MNPTKVIDLFTILSSITPNPTTELQYTNTYTLLVAVVLSAQSTDKSVNIATKNLFTKVSSPQAMLNLGLEKIKGYIKTIGLYNNKAKNIMALSKTLVANYNSIVPNDLQKLQTLSGVGRKTANVILNTAFHQPTIAVDTHVFRVSKRIGLSHATTPLEVEQDLLQVIPTQFKLNAHHWLILHGRYICKAKNPICSTCPINHLCEFTNKSL